MRSRLGNAWLWLGDRINPVLLKEMRQGMRSKVFTIMFLAIQVIMIFYLVFGLALGQGTGNSTQMDFFFWFIVGVFLLAILPIMGTNALGSENRESRLDLLVLSHLSARRITYGKWMAVIGQGTLLITALLPYLVLRYYIGSVEFHESLLIAFMLLILSAILTGIAVSLSVIKSVILRWITLVVLGFWGIPAVLSGLFSGFNSFSNAFASIPLLLITGTFVVALCMEFAAARFSPIRENHDTPKRLLLLGLLFVVIGGMYFEFDSEFVGGVFLICFGIVTWDGLCRQASNSPPVYEPFIRFGFIGRLLGRFLYPGWLPALFFCGLIGTIFFITLLLFGENVDSEVIRATILVIGIYSVPFTMILYTPLVKLPYGRIMFLIQLCLGLLMVLLYLIDESTKLNFVYLACWIPTSVFFLEMLNGLDTAKEDFFLNACAVTTGVSFILIGIKAVPQWRLATQMEKQARENRASRSQYKPVKVPPKLPENVQAR